MAPWRYDPYLWVHLAGLATVPLWIDLCLLGLAVGNPTLPGLELGVIVALGMLPVLLMQLYRPFYIFSLPGIALRPAALSDDQRRQLSQFRRWRVRLGALLVPLPLVWVLVKLYPLAFLARDITPFGDWGRLGGVAIAALGFFLANLFLQVPVAVLQVMATPNQRMAAVRPYPIEAIAADFSWLGLSVNRLLPSLAPRDALGDATGQRNLASQVEQGHGDDGNKPPLETLNPELLPPEHLDQRYQRHLNPKSLDRDGSNLAHAESVFPETSIPPESPVEAIDEAVSPETIAVEAVETNASHVDGLDSEQNDPPENRKDETHSAKHYLVEDPAAMGSPKAIIPEDVDYLEDSHLASNHPEVQEAEGNSFSADPAAHPKPRPIAVDIYP